MSKCKYDVLMKKVNENKLNEHVEVDFAVSYDLPDCRKIDTKNFVNTPGTHSYNPYSIPADVFDCNRGGCVNTGTLVLNKVDGGGVAVEQTAQYYINQDATDYASGVIAFYAKAETYPATLVVKVSDKADMTNADVYNYVLNDTTGAAHLPVVIDLSQPPVSQAGTGWSPSSAGTYISIIGKAFSISSITVLDSIEDFATKDVVKVSCLSDLGGDMSFSTLEATCWESGYDTSADPSFDITVTGQSVSPNYHKLNPMWSKGSETSGSDIVTVEKTVEDGTDHGYILLPDINKDECGYIAVQIADSCNATDSGLTFLSIPIQVAVNEGQFILTEDANGVSQLIFNQAHIGKKMLVSYPKQSTVVSEEFDYGNVDGVRARMSYPVTYTDGTKYRYVFDDVLITGFPMTLSQDTTSFTFTARIQKAKFKRLRIMD